MTAHPSRKAPSSLLAATQASSAKVSSRTRSSSRLKAKMLEPPFDEGSVAAGKLETIDDKSDAGVSVVVGIVAA